MGHVLDIPGIRAALAERGVDAPIVYLEETTSTNDVARDKLLEAVRDGTISAIDGLTVFAEYQSSGRGRLGRIWQAPRGASLLGTVLLVDPSGTSPSDEQMLLATVAACDAVTEVTDVRPRIKWPNDLVVGGRKLAGILIESQTLADGSRVFLCGFGINCLQQAGHFPDSLRPHATSLDLESAFPVDRNRVAVALLATLAARRHDGIAALREAWLARCEPLGGQVALRHDGRTYSGTTVDIDASAALVVQLDHGGRRVFHAGDTSVVSVDG